MEDLIVNDNIMEIDDSAASGCTFDQIAQDLFEFINLFQVELFNNEELPVKISFGKLRADSLDKAQIVKNNSGFKVEIIFNVLYRQREFWDLLMGLMHAMVHGWEFQNFGIDIENWYHSKIFRRKMNSFGVVCDTQGHHLEVKRDGTFAALLSRRDIAITQFHKSKSHGCIVPLKPLEKTKGRSKLKKWSCSCTNVRVAVPHFKAKCLKCGSDFKLIK